MRNVRVVSDSRYSSNGETRYIIVDDKSGRVLDDCRGKGYKSAEKAIACYKWKVNTKSMCYRYY